MAEVIWRSRIKSVGKIGTPVLCFLGPQESPFQTEPRFVQPCLQSDGTCLAGLTDRQTPGLSIAVVRIVCVRCGLKAYKTGPPRPNCTSNNHMSNQRHSEITEWDKK